VKEIKTIEKILSIVQKSNGQSNAEDVLGRQLKTMENLYKAEM
jgi:hypothetical protein